MQFLGGGGSWYDGGIWSIKETPKQLKFEPINVKHCWQSALAIFSFNVKKDNTGKHMLYSLEENEVIIYPFRAGVPHVFTKIWTEQKNT